MSVHKNRLYIKSVHKNRLYIKSVHTTNAEESFDVTFVTTIYIIY